MQPIEGSFDQLNLTKIKNKKLYLEKNKLVKRITVQAAEWEKMFADYIFDKGLLWKITPKTQQ